MQSFEIMQTREATSVGTSQNISKVNFRQELMTYELLLQDNQWSMFLSVINTPLKKNPGFHECRV